MIPDGFVFDSTSRKLFSDRYGSSGIAMVPILVIESNAIIYGSPGRSVIKILSPFLMENSFLIPDENDSTKRIRTPELMKQRTRENSNIFESLCYSEVTGEETIDPITDYFMERVVRLLSRKRENRRRADVNLYQLIPAMIWVCLSFRESLFL